MEPIMPLNSWGSPIRCHTIWISLLFGGFGVGRCGCFVAVDGKLYDRLTKDAGYVEMAGVSRNSRGTKLLLKGPIAESNGILVKIISEHGVEIIRLPSGRCEIGENGNAVAWLTNAETIASGAPGAHWALSFATGEKIPIGATNGQVGRFDFSPEKQYFLLVEPSVQAAMLPGWATASQPVSFLTPNATNMGGYSPPWRAVFRTSSPAKPLFRLPNDFCEANASIFDRGPEIFIAGSRLMFGTGTKPIPPGQDKKYRVWVLVYSDIGHGYELVRQVDLTRFSGLLDVDPTSESWLVRTRGEIFARWGLFNPDTGKFKSLGLAGAHGLFLDCGFAGYLKTHWN
jgi:hypothetical protein